MTWTTKRRANAREDVLRASANAHGSARCAYCGVKVSPKQWGADALDPVQFFTVDHIIPKAMNGCNHRDNLAAACRPCNEGRANMPLDEFIEKLGDRAVITVEQAREMMARGEAITRSVRGGLYGPV